MRLGLATALVVLALGPPLRAQGLEASGAIRGSVYDKDFEVPLPRVRVTLVEAFLATATDENGNFLFPKVAPGTYTVAFTKDGYERQVSQGVIVAPGQVAEVRIDLASEVVDLEELVVKGEDLLGNTEVGLLEVRAEAVTVQDAISSELISQAGASDAAGALKLVVGATVSEGKYATVRGLSDRYTGTTLDGVRLPSADPRKRAVNIDIFPTGTIESMTVSKTFTPDLQGDYTGGGVDIKTKSVPEEAVLTMSVGAEYNTNATGDDDFLTYRGGGLNPSGFDNGDRNLPVSKSISLSDLPRVTPRVNATPEQIEDAKMWDRYTRAFEPVIGVANETPGANGNFSFLYGDRKQWDGGAKLGWLTALTYNNRYAFYEDGENNTAFVSVAGSPPTLARARTDAQGIQELLIGFLGSVAWRPDESNDLMFRVVGNQSAEDEARFQVLDVGPPVTEQNQTLHYTERSLGSGQLLGTHRFERATFGWLAAYNLTRQDEPDLRFFRNIFDASNQSARMPANSTDAQNTRRIFREIDEAGEQGRLDLGIPFVQWSESHGEVKVGVYRETSDRDYFQRSFTYRFTSRQAGSGEAVEFNRSLDGFTAETPGALWTDVFLDPERVGLATNGAPAPNQLLWVVEPLNSDVDYTGDQTIDAAYAMAELPLSPAVKLVAGARWESTDIGVVPTNEALGLVEVISIDENGNRGVGLVPQEEAVASISESDVLPSVGAIWEIRSGMNLRGSWAKTIARPTFRELAPVATEEFIFGDEFVGNPDLVLSSVANWDLRWEWFRRPGDVLAASVFYKSLENPIEYISFAAANRSFVQPINYERGTLRGIEVEGRTVLDVLHESLRHFSAGANVTWLDSSVEVPLDEQERLANLALDEPTRALQGQPEGVVNLNLTYDDDDRGISSGIFYTAVGRTLLSGASTGLDGGTPNVYQEPLQTLDLTFAKKWPFKKRGSWSLTFKAKNLLAPEVLTIYRTPLAFEATKTRRETARLFGLTLGWAF